MRFRLMDEHRSTVAVPAWRYTNLQQQRLRWQRQSSLDYRVRLAYWNADEALAQNKDATAALEALRQALTEGGNPNQASQEGPPLLSNAAFHNHPHGRDWWRANVRYFKKAWTPVAPLVEILLAFGADPNRGHGQELSPTPLINAVRSHSLNNVRALLDAGADVHACIRGTGSTALHLAKWPEMVDVLLQAGADPCRRNLKGQTPLFLVGEYPEQIRLLVQAMVDAGGDPLAPDDEGLRPDQYLESRLLLVLEESILKGRAMPELSANGNPIRVRL